MLLPNLTPGRRLLAGTSRGHVHFFDVTAQGLERHHGGTEVVTFFVCYFGSYFRICESMTLFFRKKLDHKVSKFSD